MRGEGVEMVDGFGTEEVEKLLLCRPSEAAAMMLSITWSDSGENTTFLSDSFEKRCLAMLRETLVWLVNDSR